MLEKDLTLNEYITNYNGMPPIDGSAQRVMTSGTAQGEIIGDESMSEKMHQGIKLKPVRMAQEYYNERELKQRQALHQRFVKSRVQAPSTPISQDKYATIGAGRTLPVTPNAYGN